MLDVVSHDAFSIRPSTVATGAPPLLFLVGAPRSGTTWLAKIFDSHPNVLYRHEPDLSIIEPRLPTICDATEVDRYLRLARDYVGRMISARDIKAVGKLPVFPKAHDQWYSRRARLLAILGLRVIARLSSSKALQRCGLPEFHNFARAPQPHVVIKSISALGRMALFGEALPDARFILLVRGPLGQVASRMTGVLSGKLPMGRFDQRLLATPQAARLQVTAQTIATCSVVERMAWEWAITNQKAYDDLAHRPNARVVRYADLVADPARWARRLFAFADLPWDNACDAFIQRSVNYRGPDRYFQVMRDGARSLTKWQSILSADDQDRIAAIVSKAPIGLQCLETLQPPHRG